MNIQIITYSLYLVSGALITLVVGRDLYHNGYLLILDLFNNEDLAITIDKLLLTGYSLVNIGYVSLTLIQVGKIDSLASVLEQLAVNTGRIALILSYLHFQNIAFLAILSQRRHKLSQYFN